MNKDLDQPDIEINEDYKHIFDSKIFNTMIEDYLQGLKEMNKIIINSFNIPAEELDAKMSLHIPSAYSGQVLTIGDSGDSKWTYHPDYAISTTPIQFTIQISSEDILLSPVQDGCKHSWKIYDSGWTHYEYCSICDRKKEK